MRGECWTFPEYGVEALRVHPKHLLTPDDLAVLELYRAWRIGGPFGGVGPLPFPGGYAEQPAALMRCFQHLAAVESQFPPRKPE